MSLTQLTQGIYTLARPSSKSNEPPILCVHPFFLFTDSLQPKAEEGAFFLSGNPEQYRYDLLELLRTYPGPIVTLEEHQRLKKTSALVDSLEPVGKRFFVKTPSADISFFPETTYEMLSAFLNLLNTSSRKIACVGGYLTRVGRHTECASMPIMTFEEFTRAESSKNLWGCLGYAMQELKKEAPELLLAPDFSQVFAYQGD